MTESQWQRRAPAPPDNPTDSTYEEAKRCPRCKHTGIKASQVLNQPRMGAKVEIYECDNPLCISQYGRWIVQINPDGSIPIRSHEEKEFNVTQRELDFGKETIQRFREGELPPNG